MAAEQTHDNPAREDTDPSVSPEPTEATAPPENGGEAVHSEAPVTDEQESSPRPRIGPRILAVEEPSPPTPPTPKGGRPPRPPKPRSQQPRRRRRSAAERHRAVFFARLNELRRSGAPQAEASGEAAAGEGEPDGASADEAPIESPEAGAAEQSEPVAEAGAPDPVAEAGASEQSGPVAEAGAPDPVAEAGAPDPVGEADQGDPVAEPSSEQPPTDGSPPPHAAVDEQAASGDPAPSGAAQGARRGASPPSVAPARIAAAIERVGGPEVVQEALAPKTDEQGERKKWALVCCDAAQGSSPGDPTFGAWLRLAATPVREIKNHLPQPVDERRSGPGGRGRPGGSPRDGGGRGGRGERGDRERGGPQRDRPNREDMANYARGGRLTTKVRIVDREQEKRERDQARKEQRERKRQAERERLDRLGY